MNRSGLLKVPGLRRRVNLINILMESWFALSGLAYTFVVLRGPSATVNPLLWLTARRKTHGALNAQHRVTRQSTLALTCCTAGRSRFGYATAGIWATPLANAAAATAS